MELTDLKKKNPEELRKLLKEKQEKLRELRFRAANNQLKQVHTIRGERKIIAQIKTLLAQAKANK